MKKISVFLCLLLAVTMIFASCDKPPVNNPESTGSNTASGTSQPNDSGDVYEGMFDEGHILDINITLSEGDRTSMLSNAAAEEYYPATVTVDGLECTTAGIRTRGNVNYVTEMESGRYSYKINFGKYQKGTKLNGLDQLCLNNVSYDPSYLREYLTYLAYSKLGVNVPLVTFAKVTFNGTFAGFYVAVEAVDDAFLNRSFGDNDGSLYQGGKGTTLLTSDTSTFELENGDDDGMQNIVKLVSALQNDTGIEDILDVSSALKYFAVVSVLGIEDSYLGEKAENFYFYEQKNGKLAVIPWDFNLSFGTDSSARKTEYTIKSALVSSDVHSPYFGVNADQRPLCSVLLANSEYLQQYLGYVKTLTEFLDSLPTLLSGYKAVIESYVTADTTAFYAKELFEAEFTEGEDTLLGFIKNRSTAVKGQLAS